jgi:hypothetical protein
MHRLTALLLLAAASAPAQQIAFTSRADLSSPVSISSTTASATFGFDTVVLRNDSSEPIEAIRFEVILRLDTGDELIDGGRIVVRLAPKESKSITLGLGQVVALRLKARSARQPAALAILSVETVERPDGSIWRDKDSAHGESSARDVPLIQ